MRDEIDAIGDVIDDLERTPTLALATKTKTVFGLVRRLLGVVTQLYQRVRVLESQVLAGERQGDNRRG